MAQQLKAVWNGGGQEPKNGTIGLCWPAAGFDDPESAEYGAYCFQPDGEEIAYYCDPRHDLSFPDWLKGKPHAA